ncbi:MAG: ABC-2 transporter permease [Mariprofundaceae bacterium]|nr:ABC-2 transporter permease [Mariprofundaceae bacterium]
MLRANSSRLIFELSRFTLVEIIQSRVFRLLIGGSLLIPLIAVVIASLFMADVGKVYLDVTLSGAHFVSMVFTLFIAASLLAKDIDQRICYIILSAPIKRHEYILARYAGLSIAFAILALTLTITAYIGGYFYIGTLPELYQSGFSVIMIPMMFFYIFFQYLSLISVAVFFFSWATGTAEILLFTSSVILFSWAFPPVLAALQTEELASQTPQFLSRLIEVIYQFLPHLNGSDFALSIAHSLHINVKDLLLYMLEHSAYAGIALVLALLLFKRRDL